MMRRMIIAVGTEKGYYSDSVKGGDYSQGGMGAS